MQKVNKSPPKSLLKLREAACYNYQCKDRQVFKSPKKYEKENTV